MNTPLPGIGMDYSPSQFMARQRIESQINLPRLFAVIDADPGIVGAGVVYIDAEFNVVTLREFKPICSIRPKRIILREAQKYIAPAQFADQVKNNPRESRLVGEAVNTTLSCAGAILGWIVVFSGTIAVPFTAGASLVVTAIGATAAAASTAQCVVGGTRTYNELNDPSANDDMDSEDWYRYAMPVLDAASLLGAGASTLTTLRLLQARKVSTGRSWYELSKGLTRQQRKALTKELLTLKDPSLTNKLLKLRQRSGALAKRYTATQINHATVTQIRDSLGAAIGLTGSSLAGNLRTIAVGLYEEVE
ncbi:NAD synthetase [Pseudomonas farris]